MTSSPPATIRTTRPESSSTRRAPPRDHEPLAAGVREHVLVLRRREVGRRGAEAADHRLALVVVDEDVPEVAAPHVLLVRVAVAAHRRGVQVPDHALGVDADEQARRGVHDRGEELVLGAELGLEPLVVERERDRRRDAVEQLGLVVERVVVDERADAPAVVLDDRRGASGARAREASKRRPSRSAKRRPSSSQYASSSVGSPSAAAIASRSGVPSPIATTSPATEPRASRLRRIPSRNANGTAAKRRRKSGARASAAPVESCETTFVTSSSARAPAPAR